MTSSIQSAIHSEQTPLLTPQWKQRIFLAAAFALVLKLLLAWFSPGEQDVLTFQNFSDILRHSDAWHLYHSSSTVDSAFNYLPSMVNFVNVVRFLADATGWPFAFWLRFFSVLADVGSALVLWKIIESLPRVLASEEKSRRQAFLIYLISPVTIWVSGFHGNVDAIMMFFLLLSLLWLQRKDAAWCIGIAFGLSLNFKLMPLMLAPLFFLFLGNWRRRIEYSICLVGAVFVIGLPFFWQHPLFALQRAFGYNGLFGIWGISRILRATPDWSQFSFFFLKEGRFMLLFALLLCTFWMSRLRCKPDLYRQCAILMLLFLVLTPGFGAQYLAWLAPLIVVLGAPPTAIYTIGTAIFLTLNYFLAWHRSQHLPISTFYAQMLIETEIVCWMIIVVLFVGETRRLARENKLSPI